MLLGAQALGHLEVNKYVEERLIASDQSDRPGLPYGIFQYQITHIWDWKIHMVLKNNDLVLRNSSELTFYRFCR